MHELTGTSTDNSAVRQEYPFLKKQSEADRPVKDRPQQEGNIAASDRNVMDHMSSRQDPGFHKLIPQTSPASIQMAPNPNIDRVQRKEDVDDMEQGELFHPELQMHPEQFAGSTTIKSQAGEQEGSLQMLMESQEPGRVGKRNETGNSVAERITSNPPPIQLQNNPEEPQNEQTSGSTTGEQADPQVQVCDRTRPEAELQQREEILQDLTREFQINQSVRNVLISSLCDFSINQLQQMQQSGLRIWRRGSLPPVFAGDNIEIDTSGGGHASYVKGVRTIFLTERVNSGFLTHEMAHAWDHIRNLPARLRVRLESLPRRRRRQLAQHPGRYLSETNRRQQLNVEGAAAARGFTFEQMYQNYLRRLPRREMAFSRAASEGYSRVSAQEFYAEGYAVFHGTSEYEQAKIYKYARELYIYLHDEATNENMPVPNLTNIIAQARRLPAPR